MNERHKRPHDPPGPSQWENTQAHAVHTARKRMRPTRPIGGPRKGDATTASDGKATSKVARIIRDAPMSDRTAMHPTDRLLGYGPDAFSVLPRECSGPAWRRCKAAPIGSRCTGCDRPGWRGAPRIL